MSSSSLGPESNATDLWILPPQDSSIEGVETDTYLLVSVYGKGVDGVPGTIDHYSEIAVFEFLICTLVMINLVEVWPVAI